MLFEHGQILRQFKTRSELKIFLRKGTDGARKKLF